MLNLKLKSILGSWEFEIFQQASCWPRYLAVFCGHLISITSPHRIMYANIQHPLCNSAACCPHITQTKFQQNQTSPNKLSKSWRTTDDNWRSKPITSAELWSQRSSKWRQLTQRTHHLCWTLGHSVTVELKTRKVINVSWKHCRWRTRLVAD